MADKFRYLTAIVLLLCLAMASHGRRRPPRAEMTFIDSLLSVMTVEEKAGQLVLVSERWDLTGPTEGKECLDDIRSGMCGNLFNVLGVENIRKIQKVAVEESRLGIPLMFGYDEVHGYRTIFPIPLAESCSWNLEAMENSARIGAYEAASDGLNWVYAPMVDISVDPRWGRVAEGAGEDPYLGSLIAAARVRGIQGDGLSGPGTVMACVKHYAAYGAPVAGREYNTVDMSDRMFRETYLPPYAAAVRSGAGSVMTSFNEFDGVPATGNGYLLEDVLRRELGFGGFVVTDYSSMSEMIAHGYSRDLADAARQAISAGVDMDMMGDAYRTALVGLVKDGIVPEDMLDKAVRRVLEAKQALGLFDDPYRYCRAESTHARTPEHLEAARQMARESMVLLKNDGVLPLKKGEKIAVIGRGAVAADEYVGCWCGRGYGMGDLSILDALKEKNGSGNVTYSKGCDWTGNDRSGFGDALAVAESADKVVFVMGESRVMSGEAASRSDIRIPGVQTELLEKLAAAGKKVAVVLLNGRPLDLSRESVAASAILDAWFPGSMGGPAVADVLFNDWNPSGKLTMTFPRSVGQVPLYYYAKNTGRPYDGKGKYKYKSKYSDIPNSPLYPFGHGLSYTEFEYGSLSLSDAVLRDGGVMTASVTVTNSGKYAGTEVVQLYLRDLVGSVTRPVMQLKDFRRITLEPGESRSVVFEITPDMLAFYRQDRTWGAEEGDFLIFVGSSSEDVTGAGFSYRP